MYIKIFLIMINYILLYNANYAISCKSILNLSTRQYKVRIINNSELINPKILITHTLPNIQDTNSYLINQQEKYYGNSIKITRTIQFKKDLGIELLATLNQKIISYSISKCVDSVDKDYIELRTYENNVQMILIEEIYHDHSEDDYSIKDIDDLRKKKKLEKEQAEYEQVTLRKKKKLEKYEAEYEQVTLNDAKSSSTTHVVNRSPHNSSDEEELITCKDIHQNIELNLPIYLTYKDSNDKPVYASITESDNVTITSHVPLYFNFEGKLNVYNNQSDIYRKKILETKDMLFACNGTTLDFHLYVYGIDFSLLHGTINQVSLYNVYLEELSFMHLQY